MHHSIVIHGINQGETYSFTLLNRSELLITDTELKLSAAAVKSH